MAYPNTKEGADQLRADQIRTLTNIKNRLGATSLRDGISKASHMSPTQLRMYGIDSSLLHDFSLLPEGFEAMWSRIPSSSTSSDAQDRDKAQHKEWNTGVGANVGSGARSAANGLVPAPEGVYTGGAGAGTGHPATDYGKDPSGGVYTGGAGAGPGGLTRPAGNPPAAGSPSSTPSSPSWAIPDLVTKLPDVQYPNAPNITVTWHDFSEAAKKKVGEAYAPLYQSIAGAKTNAQTQATDSQAVIKGMYDNLLKDEAAQAGATTKGYNQNINATRAEGNAQQQQIGSIYGDAESDTAAMMAQAGLGGASGGGGTLSGAEIATGVTNQEAGAKEQALAATNQQVGNLRTARQDQQDYAGNIASADRSASASERSDIVRDLGGILAQYDAQKLGTQSQEIQDATSMAQQMGTNDFNAQNTTADQAWKNYQAAVGKTEFQSGQDRANVELKNAAEIAAANAENAGTKTEIGAQVDMAKLLQDDAQFKQTMGFNYDKLVANSANDAEKNRITTEQNAAGNILREESNKIGLGQLLQRQYEWANDPKNSQLASNPHAKYLRLLAETAVRYGDPKMANTLDQLIQDTLATWAKTGAGDKDLSVPATFVDFIKLARQIAKSKGIPEDAAEMAAFGYQFQQKGVQPEVPVAQAALPGNGSPTTLPSGGTYTP